MTFFTQGAFGRSLVALLIALTLVAPSFFIAATPKAEAQTGILGCIAGAFGFNIGAAATSLGGGAIGGAVGLFVPVWTMADTSVPAVATQTATGALTFKECVLDAIVWALKNIIIPQLTASIVEWINSGFTGLPTFLGNPQEFFLDLADIIAGEFIFGGPLDFLCSPFQLQVQVDLQLEYAAPASGETGRLACRLSDVYGNVADAVTQFQDFISGSFQSGGFPAWFSLTMKPQNNPYGSFLAAQAEMGIRVRNKQGAEFSLLSWGDGFLSITDPATGQVITPGQYISRELEDWTGAPLAQLEVADEIDEILGALFQLLVRTLLEGGVGNASVAGAGGQSALQQIRDEAAAGGTASQQALVARINAIIASETAAGQTFYIAELQSLAAQAAALDPASLTYTASLSAIVARVNAIESEITARNAAQASAGIDAPVPAPPPPPTPPPPTTGPGGAELGTSVPGGGTGGGTTAPPPPPPPPAAPGGTTPTTGGGTPTTGGGGTAPTTGGGGTTAPPPPPPPPPPAI